MLLIFWILCGLFASVVAGNKGHNGFMWALGGFLLGPLALLATLGLGDRETQRKQNDLLEETRKHNAWMRRKMYEAEEERRYYEEERYRERMRQLPPEEYFEEEDSAYYDNNDKENINYQGHEQADKEMKGNAHSGDRSYLPPLPPPPPPALP
jgi:hypothetical protein